MRIIGLTGGIACGKSTVAGFLREAGYPVADADAVSHSVTGPEGSALPAIREAFGDAVFHADGTLNRRALAAEVFEHPASLETLNAVTHPLILAEMLRQTREAEENGAQIVIWDVPLLFESGFDKLCDETVCVVAPREEQIVRLALRDGLSREEAVRRIDSQMPLEEKAARCGRVIHTCPTLEELRNEVRSVFPFLND